MKKKLKEKIRKAVFFFILSAFLLIITTIMNGNINRELFIFILVTLGISIAYLLTNDRSDSE